MELFYKTHSHKGKRAINEDDYYPRHGDDHNNLFMVCDGIGGHGDGDLASAFVTGKLPALLSQYNQGFEKMESAVHEIHKDLKVYAEQAGNPNMGCTLAILKIIKKDAWLCWVGDSRIYQIRNEKILLKTKDHSLLQLLLDDDRLSQEQADNFSMKNVIYQAIGSTTQTIKPSIKKINNVQEGDIFLLGSDGFFESWADDELLSVINQAPEALALELKNKCLIQSKDNFTFTLVKAVSS